MIGINSQIATGGSGGGSVGIGFAVPSSTAQRRRPAAARERQVEHAFLGISGADVSPQLADALNLPVDQGALVEDVTKGGPAETPASRPATSRSASRASRSLAGGDVITAVDGQPVTGMDDVIAAVNAKQAGDQVQLDVLRDGDTAARHRHARRAPRPRRPSGAGALRRPRQRPLIPGCWPLCHPWRMRIKVCGITNLDDAEAAVGLGAWAIGLNHHPESPRLVDARRRGRDRRRAQASLRGRRRVRQRRPSTRSSAPPRPSS